FSGGADRTQPHPSVRRRQSLDVRTAQQADPCTLDMVEEAGSGRPVVRSAPGREPRQTGPGTDSDHGRGNTRPAFARTAASEGHTRQGEKQLGAKDPPPPADHHWHGRPKPGRSEPPAPKESPGPNGCRSARDQSGLRGGRPANRRSRGPNAVGTHFGPA